jgi:hypothetical protein
LPTNSIAIILFPARIALGGRAPSHFASHTAAREAAARALECRPVSRCVGAAASAARRLRAARPQRRSAWPSRVGRGRRRRPALRRGRPRLRRTGRRPCRRAVELRRSGGPVAEPAEFVKRPDRVGGLATRLRECGRLAREPTGHARAHRPRRRSRRVQARARPQTPLCLSGLRSISARASRAAYRRTPLAGLAPRCDSSLLLSGPSVGHRRARSSDAPRLAGRFPRPAAAGRRSPWVLAQRLLACTDGRALACDGPVGPRGHSPAGTGEAKAANKAQAEGATRAEGATPAGRAPPAGGPGQAAGTA